MPLNMFAEKKYFNRNNELETLQGIASEAKAGDASSIFLSGKPGTGKTELLRQLFNRLFTHQDNAIPFFYSVSTSFVSAEDFSRDYICRFLLQGLAFLNKERSLLDTEVYYLEDIVQLAKEKEAQWAVDIMDNYLRVKEKNRPINLFLFALSVPYRCYLSTDTPVVLMIDDFHNTRNFYELDPGENRDLWMHFGNSINLRFAPFIFTGLQSELHKMFFEETSFGKDLELFSLTGLNRDDAVKYFESLCKMYGVNIDGELLGFIDVFDGNPSYIKSFTQAVRQSARTFSEDDFLEIYLKEVTTGKMYTHWTSRLKSHIPKFDLRKPSLNFLHNMCGNGAETDFSDLHESLSVGREELEKIVSMLHASGAVETGFSLLELADDQILVDVIKGLYHREIYRDPTDKIKEVIIGDKHKIKKRHEGNFFDIAIPSVAKAELIAVKSLEQIARHFNIPSKTAGQLQIALVELFTRVLERDGAPPEDCRLKFMLKENIFSIEVKASLEDLTVTDADIEGIKSYLDDMKVERVMSGTKITLVKDIREDLTASQ